MSYMFQKKTSLLISEATCLMSSASLELATTFGLQLGGGIFDVRICNSKIILYWHVKCCCNIWKSIWKDLTGIVPGCALYVIMYIIQYQNEIGYLSPIYPQILKMMKNQRGDH